MQGSQKQCRQGQGHRIKEATGEPESKDEEATGSGSGSAPPAAAEESTYPEAPGKRIEMKRQAAEEKKPVAKAKVMAERQKRARELRIDPPVAKVKPNPAQGTK